MPDPDLFLFVSHVSEDHAAAMEIVAELERRGAKCWIAPRDVRPGSRFDDEIADALDNCCAMLLIFSDLCNESEYIHREVTVAGQSHKVIIPFRIEDAEPRRGLRVRLSDLHWIDGFVSRERAIDELARAVPQSVPEPGRREQRQRQTSAPPGLGSKEPAAGSFETKPTKAPRSTNPLSWINPLYWRTRTWIISGALLMAIFIISALIDLHLENKQEKWTSDIAQSTLLMALSPLLGMLLKFIFFFSIHSFVFMAKLIRKYPMECCGATIGFSFVIFGISDDYDHAHPETWTFYIFMFVFCTIIGAAIGSLVRIIRNRIVRFKSRSAPQ